MVNLYDAAAPGRGGLLRPLLGRLRAHGCPPTVFALPAVQVMGCTGGAAGNCKLGA